MKVGEGLVGAAVAEAAPILVNDVRNDPRMSKRCWIARRAGRAARRKGRVIGALNVLSDTPGQFTDTDVMILRHSARTSRSGSKTRGCSSRSAIHVHARGAGGHRARVRRDPASRRAAHTDCAPRPPGDRLSDVRDPPAQRRHAGARDEGGGAHGDMAALPRIKLGAASSGTPRCTRSRWSSPTCRPIRVISRSSRMRDPSWSSCCW